jgi:hypothetical protein
MVQKNINHRTLRPHTAARQDFVSKGCNSRYEGLRKYSSVNYRMDRRLFLPSGVESCKGGQMPLKLDTMICVAAFSEIIGWQMK